MARLPELIYEVAERVIADDWLERKSPDGERSYYVIGADAYVDDLETDLSYSDRWVVPKPEIGLLLGVCRE
jgi:hypothetical protein